MSTARSRRTDQAAAHPPDSPRYLNVDQVSKKTGLPKSTVYRLIAEGRLPAHKISDRIWLVVESELHDHILSRPPVDPLPDEAWREDIRRRVAKAPPLSAETANRIAAILASAGNGGTHG